MWRRLQPYVKRGVWPCCGYGEQPAVGAIQAHRLDEPGQLERAPGGGLGLGLGLGSGLGLGRGREAHHRRLRSSLTATP